MAASRLTAKTSTASGLAENLPTRLLVKGMTVMVNRNAKFHQARPSRCPVIRRKTRFVFLLGGSDGEPLFGP
jgi:hypothetical protein